MIKHFAKYLVTVLGVAYSSYPGYTAAQEASGMDANMGAFPAEMHQGMVQNSPFISPGTLPNPNPYTDNRVLGGPTRGAQPGAPLILLPVPANSMSGINTPYGTQFPGSYMPGGTPLHRYNGYVVCDPPDLNKGTATGAATGATAQRIVKITTTRSPSAPSHQQPCPVYTVNGEIQPPKGYTTTTTTTPSIRSAP
ncbi:hypothetical protein C8R32_101342 [Nitrosospira sp. Nsp5]|uniref:Uncharacterized protein n=1 Tax=Nitrosospira multiformis TaxID=1231 RepID=A0ABY0TFD2_9PROT|nr:MULTISPECIES: hypothetical protein [Nitrosospira]PTR10812.1 hypothetical protein C8R32_101342 [Nitrosospira sp. Nsp5]SDQ74410.1 hypothetical protein SAMN05216402_2113 [Nitrosospira multiformis]